MHTISYMDPFHISGVLKSLIGDEQKLQQIIFAFPLALISQENIHNRLFMIL